VRTLRAVKISKWHAGSSYLALFLISLIISGLVLLLREAGTLEALELEAYDRFTRMRCERLPPDPRIVLITISEKDLQTEGAWPVNDATLADILRLILRGGPQSIGLDLFRDVPVPPGQDELHAILSENRNIIGVMKFGPHAVPCHPAFRNTDQSGFNDILVDPGGIVRRALVYLDDGKTVFYSFPLRLALHYLDALGIHAQADPTRAECMRLGHKTILPLEPNDGGYVRADTRGYQFLIDFHGAGGGFRSFSLQDLLSGRIDEATFRDKIVLVGVVAESVKDFFYTPLSRSLHEGQHMAGVVLHGHVTGQLIRLALGQSSPIRSLGERQEMAWTILWGFMGGAVGLLIRSPWRFSMAGLAGLLILVGSGYLAFLGDWWIPLIPPGMGWTLSSVMGTAYVSNREKRERHLLMQIFSRHVSKEIADAMWQQRHEFLENGRPRPQKVIATTLFSDLRGFTTVSEKFAPEDLMDWLNTYLEAMAKVIIAHNGVIDNYAGDGIKANFGIPVPRTKEEEIQRDAFNAVKCALAMEMEMEQLNEVWKGRHLPAVGMRIGIFTGPVIAGLLGGSERFKYTTIGDSVNTASRLESYDKDLGKDRLCRILVGEPTMKYVQGHFRAEKVGEASLKGKTEKVVIYRILPSSEA
jgi:adenylate cyclase